MYKMFVGLMIAAVFLCAATSAHAQNSAEQLITRDESGIYYAQIMADGQSKIFPVYCMNRNLKWPDDSHKYILDQEHLKEFDGLYEQLQRLLFAGYPTNGMNIYTLGQTAAITEETYNQMLIVPDEILSYQIGGSFPFSYLAEEKDGETVKKVILLDGTNKELATQFVNDVSYQHSLDDDGERLIMGSPFYLAASFLSYSSAPEEAMELLSDRLAMTEYNMWLATQVALYKLLYDHQVPNNGKVSIDIYPYAREIYEFAKQREPEILIALPGPIELTGNSVFTRDAASGEWYSEFLTIIPRQNHAGTYQLELPQGITHVQQEPGPLRAGQPFRLASQERPEDGLEIVVKEEVRWPSEVFHFEPVNEEELYQHMAGVYVNAQTLRAALPVSSQTWEEPNVPMPAPEEPANIPQANTQPASAPKTGDDFQLELALGLLLISSAVIGVLAYRKRRA